jgi:drug/metabolite transporter (DMT)-like permease
MPAGTRAPHPATPAGTEVAVDDRPARHRGELYAALVATGFGSAYVATAFALAAFAPVPAAMWRSVLATLLVGAMLALRRVRGRADVAVRERVAAGAMPMPPEVPGAPASDPPAHARPASGRGARAARLLLLSLLAGPIFLAAMNLAVAGVGAAVAAFVAGLYAILSAVIAPALLPERLTGRILAGFILALLGTALLAELDPSGTQTAGMAWGIVAATAFALYLVLARRWSRPYRLDGLAVAFANSAMAAVVLGVLVVASDPGAVLPSDPTPSAMAGLAWAAAVAAFGPVLTIASVRLIPAARSAAFLLLNPIAATILAALLLGQWPSPLQAAGGALVLLGMATVTLPRKGGDQVQAAA